MYRPMVFRRSVVDFDVMATSMVAADHRSLVSSAHLLRDGRYTLNDQSVLGGAAVNPRARHQQGGRRAAGCLS
jgi:hypothetical protein